MDTPSIIAILVVSVITAMFWGASLSVRLPEIDHRFDRKPFNCRPCLTFHSTWMLTTFFALIARSYELFAAGAIAAFVVFFIVRYIDNKKIEE